MPIVTRRLLSIPIVPLSRALSHMRRRRHRRNKFATVVMRAGSISIPLAAIVQDTGDSYVYVQKMPERFKRRKVKIDLREGDQILFT